MSKLVPIITEKTTNDATNGRYTFLVDKNLNKFQIKQLVEETFGVHVVSVATINMHAEKKRTISGKIKKIKPTKKAMVTLKEKESIDLFEEKKK